MRKQYDFYMTPDDHVSKSLDFIAKNRNRPLIIAGNGPSLASIDYSRLPENPLIMRINNFFFEGSYYLGDRADFVFVAGHPDVVNDYVNTLLTVSLRREYSTGIYLGRTANLWRINQNYFPLVDVKKAMISNKEIADFMTKAHFHPGVLPTSGIIAALSAIAFGFQDIYIAGIDLYSQSENYAFDIGKEHARLVGIKPGQSGYLQEYHSLVVDVEGLLLAREQQGVNLWSVCPDSPINAYIPLAEVTNKNSIQVTEKPKGYVNDFIPIPRPVAPESKNAPRKLSAALADRVRRKAAEQSIVERMKDWILLKKSDAFDQRWYLQKNGDVAASGMSAHMHFLRFGCSEGRWPSPEFNTAQYYKNNPEAASTGVNALVHSLRKNS